MLDSMPVCDLCVQEGREAVPGSVSRLCAGLHCYEATLDGSLFCRQCWTPKRCALCGYRCQVRRPDEEAAPRCPVCRTVQRAVTVSGDKMFPENRCCASDWTYRICPECSHVYEEIMA